jgi:hypothetical protein
VDTDQLVSFLGHSSVHGALDAFLSAHGTTRRPRLSDSYPYKVATPVPGLALAFEDSAQVQALQMARKSDGEFVLHELYFDCDPKKHDGAFFQGLLPLGMGTARSMAQIEAALGTPRVRRDSTNPRFPGLFASYLAKEGIVVQLKFTDAEGSALKFVRVGLLDSRHVAQGLA